MIDHVTIKVRDLEGSRKFYEEAFAPLGYKVTFGKAGDFWAFDIGNGLFEIAQYAGKTPLTPCHVALRVEDHKKVELFYDCALRAGGKDFGAPGPRPNYTPNYYACFILDPDGHNIEAMFDS